MRSESATFSELDQSVLETLLYFWTEKKPLLLSEIDRFLLGKETEKNNLSKIRQSVNRLREGGLIRSKKGFYFPDTQEKFSWLDQADRVKEAHKKIELLTKALRWISKINSIKALCVCGSVAGRNCSKESDIDLMVVTQKNRAWTARFWLTALSWLLKKKKSESHSRKNKFCLNHYRDTDNLRLEKEIMDLYSVKEYTQMIRLFGRGEEECPILSANIFWMKNHLANFFPNKPALFDKEKIERTGYSAKYFEKVVRLIQLRKINRPHGRNTEQLDRSRIILENGVIMFHLNPKAPIIEARFSKLKNKFFSDNEYFNRPRRGDFVH